MTDATSLVRTACGMPSRVAETRRVRRDVAA
jgi:hypothetical protein